MNQNYTIATASTCDLTREYLDSHNIPFISYSYTMGDALYEDDCTEDARRNVYRKMRDGADISTAAINTYTYFAFFEKLVKDKKNIIFLDMCRPLSASWKFCDEAIEILKEKYPDVTVVNVDTRCVSGGLGMLVTEVIKLYEAGKTMEEVLSWIEDNKLRISHRFTVDDLKWLKKGGRVSNAAALVGTLLSIKPVLYVPNEGTLEVVAKVRGRKAALSMIIESITKDITDHNEHVVFQFNHADCMEDAEYVRDKLLEILPNAEISIASLGVVIGAHTGPGLLAIFYMTDERRPK